MHIYFLRPDSNNYQKLVFSRENDADIFIDKFDGTPIKDSWTPLELRVYRDDKFNKNLPPSDFPSFAYKAPVFSRHAVDKLHDFLTENGELFSITCSEGDYFIYNVTRVADVLDIENSTVKRFKSSGRIMEIVKYAFFHKRLSNLAIFKLPEIPEMDVFATDSFVQRVQESDLTGFHFEEIWTDSTV